MPGSKSRFVSRLIYALLVLLLIILGGVAWVLMSRGPVDTAPPPEAYLLWDLGERHETTMAQILPELTRTRLVFVGETHTEQAHHEAQLAVIKCLAPRVKLAVGLEMMEYGNQDILDGWVAGELFERDVAQSFAKDWSEDWRLYRPFFMYCRERGIPMVALNVPREITRKVASVGFQSLTRKELGELPPLSCKVRPEYESFLRQVLGEHAQSTNFTFFCEAQLVWDTAMAVHAVNYLKNNPETAMVVLTGTVHAWKMAVPTQVASLAPELSQRVLLPRVPGRLEERLLTDRDADYLILGKE